MDIWPINYMHIQHMALGLVLCMHLEHREHFLARLSTAVLIFAMPLLIPGGFFSPYFMVGSWFSFGFILSFLIVAGWLYFLFRMTGKQMLFYFSLTVILQHACHCLSRVITLLFGLETVPAQIVQLLLFLTILAGTWFVMKRELKEGEPVDFKSAMLIFFASLAALIAFFLSYWTTQVEGESIGVHTFDLLTCILLVVIIMDMFRLRRAEREQLMMERMIRLEREQHEMSRASIEVINRKCHDLKHQISALRNMNNPEEKERSIRDLEDAVMIYDRFTKSGNADFDVILAEKGMLAEEYGVRLQCMVDGEKLGFLEIADLYTLMGNALDNAIEAAVSEPVPEKRVVILNVSARGQILVIHEENPCAEKPVFVSGLPLTTKGDTDYHGFGMQSMRYIVEKYDGAMKAGWENGVFSLDILFPLKKADKT